MTGRIGWRHVDVEDEHGYGNGVNAIREGFDASGFRGHP